MKHVTAILIVVAWCMCSSTHLLAEAKLDASSTVSPSVSFYRDVRPILQARCQGCHQPAKASGNYDMTSVDAMLQIGESELAGVVAGKPEESHLIEQITPQDGVARVGARP